MSSSRLNGGNRSVFRLLFLLLKLLWKIIVLPFRIYWHPVTLFFITVFIEWIFITRNGRSTFTFSTQAGQSMITKEIVYFIFGVLLYGLGVAYRISGLFIRHTVLLMVLSGFVIYRLFDYYGKGMDTGFAFRFIQLNLMLLFVIATETFFVTVIRSLARLTRGVWISSVVSKIRIYIAIIISAVRWILNHRVLMIIIIIQLGTNAFILYRMKDMESRIGGSLFTMCSAEQSIKSMKSTIVRIATDKGEGTGMIIREEGYILTNAHVVSDDPAPKIIFQDYTFKPSKVIFRDKDKDIAVVKVDGSGYKPAVFIDPKNILQRSVLYVIGYPLGTELRGDATVVKYMFTAVRSLKDVPTDMIQLEGVGTGGASGSPVMTSCGEVAGMFTAGTQGISLAISSKSIWETIGFLSLDQSTWPKPPEYTLEPDKSPEEAVRAYYTFIKMRDFKRAYLMLTPERVASVSLETWTKGYDKTLDVTLINIEKKIVTPTPEINITATPTPTPGKGQPSSLILSSVRVHVRIRSLDLEGQDIVPKYFEGPWIVVYDGEFWRLSDSNIKLVEKPGWDWFW